jgi:hypothetical protein
VTVQRRTKAAALRGNAAANFGGIAEGATKDCHRNLLRSRAKDNRSGCSQQEGAFHVRL